MIMMFGFLAAFAEKIKQLATAKASNVATRL
jgi:hypothetical protein